MIRRVIAALAVVAAIVVGAFAVFGDDGSDVQFVSADAMVNGRHEIPLTGVLKAGGTRPASNIYGWKWEKVVTVHDGTGNPRWRVADAVQTWNRDGLQIVMTEDAAAADITVTQGDAMAMCGTNQALIGCGDTTVVDGKPVHGTIVMQESFADWDYVDTLYGGTIHELGHTIGFGHAPAPMTNADSVMGIPIPAACGGGCARTTLSQYDRAGLRTLY